MALLTEAELVLGLSRHLSAYAMGSERAALGNLEFAGWVFDLAFRLRGSTTSSAQRVSAIGLDVGLSSRNLTAVLATLDTIGWVTVARDAQGRPVSVAETMPAAGEMVRSAPRLLEIVGAEPVELAALDLLRATAMQPLVVDDALARAAVASTMDSAETAEDALRHLAATGLVRRVEAADGRTVVYNPNVWVQGDDVARAALRAADAGATREVGALLEELSTNPGLPEARVTSTEARWIQFAVSQGLVQRSVIQTSDGAEQGFLFTPHLARDPFGGTAGDASGHVRQLVGSMIYATTFATYRLRSPAAFLRALLSRGLAGDASSIGTDYPMLEKAGIVRVVPGSSQNRFSLELLQADVAEDALRLIEGPASAAEGSDDAAALRAQRAYVYPERERARLALETRPDETEQARLLAALRETSARRAIGSP